MVINYKRYVVVARAALPCLDSGQVRGCLKRSDFKAPMPLFGFVDYMAIFGT